ncbi:MAG: DUF3135 domain-containing protein [Minisyncoccota bacterium]
MEKDVRDVPLDKDFFKYWSELSKNDPKRFEQERREAIEKAISHAPENKQEALRQLQGRIDRERSRASDSLPARILSFIRRKS